MSLLLLLVWGVYLGMLVYRSFELRAWYKRVLEEEIEWLEEHQEFQSKAITLGLLRFEVLFGRSWELYFKPWVSLEDLEEPIFNYYREDLN